MSINKALFISGVCDRYDERLLDDRATIEGNVCGCVLHDLTLLDDSGMSAKDFLTIHGRLLFRLAELLRSAGFTECDEVTYVTNVGEETRAKIDSEVGGWRQIATLIDVVSSKNWDAFYDAFNKSNVLLSLYLKGFNLFGKIIIGDDNGKPGKEVYCYNFLKSLTSSQVVEYYDGVVSSVATKVSSSKIVEESYVEFDETWLNTLSNQEEMGTSFGDAGPNIKGDLIKTFPYMSSNLLGLKHGTISAFAAQSGTGKTSYMVTVAMSLVAKGEKIIIVTNESRVSELKTLFFTWIINRVFDYWKLPKRKFISGNLSDEDRAMIKTASEYWNKNCGKMIKIVVLADADATLSSQIIKKHILREGFSTFLVDTMKLTFSEKDEAGWMSLIRDVRELTEVALKYDVIGLITLQLAPATENRLWLDVSCLANCKQIKETLSNLILFRKIKPDELNPSSSIYIKPFRNKQKEDGSWYKDPYDADPTKNWVVMFVDKCRRGVDSGTNGEAFLCRTDLDYVSFYETAKCYPSRKVLDFSLTK